MQRRRSLFLSLTPLALSLLMCGKNFARKVSLQQKQKQLVRLSLSAVSRHKSQIMKEKEATRPAHIQQAHTLAAAAESGAAYQKREKSQKALRLAALLVSLLMYNISVFTARGGNFSLLKALYAKI